MDYADFKERYMLEFVKMFVERPTPAVLESFCKTNYELSKKLEDFKKSTVWANAANLLEDQFSADGDEYTKVRFLETLYKQGKVPEKVLNLSAEEMLSRLTPVFIKLPLHESLITIFNLVGWDYDQIIYFVTFSGILIRYGIREAFKVKKVLGALNDGISTAQLYVFSRFIQQKGDVFTNDSEMGKWINFVITHERSAKADLSLWEFIWEFPDLSEYNDMLDNHKGTLSDNMNQIFANKFEYVSDRGPEKNKLLRNICKRTRQKILDSRVLEN